MKILITGGSGYLGGALTDFTAPVVERIKSSNVRVYDSLVYEESYRKDVDFVLGDVRDYEKLKSHLEWADCVVWLAGIVGDGACALNPARATEVNYDAVKYLVDNFDGRIVFPSTCSVYGAQDDLLNEESPTNPLSLYASTKLKAEALLKDKNAIIFRLGTLYGLGDEWSRPRFDLVVNTLTAKAVTEGKLRVFGGEQYRPLLHVKDAAQAIFDNLDSEHTGVFNLHTENMKILNIATAVTAFVKDADVEIVETTFEDSRNYKVESSKFWEICHGWSRWFTVSDGIKEVKDLIESGRIKDVNNPRYTNQGFLSA